MEERRVSCRVLVDSLPSAVVLLAGSVFAGAQSLPPALDQALQARSREVLRTGEIEFCVTDQLDRRLPVPTTRFFSWTCAGDNIRQIDRGDQDGLTTIWDTGSEVRQYREPIQYLLTPDELWVANTPLLGAPPQIRDRESADVEAILDLRGVGSNPADLTRSFAEFVARRRAEGAADFEYETSLAGDLHVVTARDGDAAYQWYIDPTKDWSIVRTTSLWAGKLQYEMVFTSGLCDGHWIPTKIEVFRRAGGETEPAQTFEIISARFNRPEHRQELTPDDIGIEAGATVIAKKPRQPVRGFRWTGAELVDSLVFAELLRSGAVEVSPATLRERRRGRAAFEHRERMRILNSSSATTQRGATSQPAGPLRDWESIWEQYTREFVAAHKLSDEQTQRAWQICRESEARAIEHLTRHRAELDALDARARDSKTLPETEVRKRLASIDTERQRLLAPIERLFEEQFKPRLDKLLTPAQRAASQPGRKAP